MEQAVRDWEMCLRGLERKSERTISGYLWNIRHLAAAFPGKSALHYTRKDLEHYLAERALHGWSDSTARQAVATFRKFFGYVCGKKSPARTLPFPRRSKPVRKIRSLTADQASEVLVTFDTATPGGRRDLALVALMIDTGLRSSEVCRLKVSDLDRKERFFEVMAKGGRVRRGRFSTPTGDYLEMWLGSRAAVAQSDVETVFVSLGGKTPGRPLTNRGLREILRRVALRAGLPALAPHDLRRTFAHLALRAGAPTRVLQVAGGWQQLREVETYSREITPEDFDAYSPINHLMGSETA